MWQRQFALREYSKGCHLITDQVLAAIKEGLKEGNANGLLHLFVQHTSCALSLNENYDPDVRRDMDMALNHIVPDTLPWRHTDEGPDDSSSHTKSALIGASITIPITNHVRFVFTPKASLLVELTLYSNWPWYSQDAMLQTEKMLTVKHKREPGKAFIW